jgi:hypothetical protein
MAQKLHSLLKKYTFGRLKFSPSTLERLLEDVLRGLHWQECILYMDDIIVPGSCFDECIKRLTNMFERLIYANLKLKPSKCVFPCPTGGPLLAKNQN